LGKSPASLSRALQDAQVLSPSEIEQFIELGYVRVAGAYPQQVAQRCRDLARAELQMPIAPPWPGPVRRGLVEGAPFR
jgi:hypothetical protein